MNGVWVLCVVWEALTPLRGCWPEPSHSVCLADLVQWDKASLELAQRSGINPEMTAECWLRDYAQVHADEWIAPQVPRQIPRK